MTKIASSVKVTANAKINLTLDITGKRDDGYHKLETIMQSVSLADEVEISLISGGGILLTCDNPRLPQGIDNLAFRAAEHFLAANHIKNPGLRINIKKRIPVQAGLAGGSADAAAVLAGLDALLGAHTSAQALAGIALGLGVDVPFCCQGGTMLASGIGEKLAPLPMLPDCFIVIAKPRESVSTAAAYAAFDRLGDVARPCTRQVCDAIECGSITDVAGGLCNVFEAVTRLPVISLIKDEMRGFGALGACMSGSGSAVFGLFDDPSKAEMCVNGLCCKYQGAFLCHPVRSGCKITELL